MIWRDYLELTKPKVVYLIVFTAIVGTLLASPGWPPLGALLWGNLGIALAAACAAAVNHVLDQRIDEQMARTRNRPLPKGRITTARALAFACTLGVASMLVLWLLVNPLTAVLTFFSLIGYAVIYTVWLKRATSQNIVIGGAAGSAAVLSGSAAAGMWNAPGALVLAAILFLWTPFHFWSLAILYRDEYKRADVPMLPTQTTPRKAAWWVMSHTLPTGVLSLLMVVLPGLGWIFFVPVLLITVDLFYRNVQLIRDPSPVNARKLFMSSNYYLLVLLVAICVDLMLPW